MSNCPGGSPGPWDPLVAGDVLVSNETGGSDLGQTGAPIPAHLSSTAGTPNSGASQLNRRHTRDVLVSFETGAYPIEILNPADLDLGQTKAEMCWIIVFSRICAGFK